MKKEIAILAKNKVKVLFPIFAMLLLFCLGSCMTSSPTLLRDHVPKEGSGYIYGRFSLLTEQNTSQIAFGESTIGIVVKNLDTSKKYSFRLEEKDTIQMLEVPPGNYRIDLVEHLSGETIPATENFNMEGYQNDFVVEANTAVYIGDFSGKAERKYNNFVWSLEQAADNYNITTLDAHEKFLFLRKTDITFVSNMK